MLATFGKDREGFKFSGARVLVGADVNLWASATCCGETCETLAVASKEVGLAVSAEGAV